MTEVGTERKSRGMTIAGIVLALTGLSILGHIRTRRRGARAALDQQRAVEETLGDPRIGYRHVAFPFASSSLACSTGPAVGSFRATGTP